jgi:FKBP-type peptidyl-prolyl cis-trans isomerase (trigger factor)
MENIKITKMPESITKIDAIIPAEKFESFEAKALEVLGKDREFTGFRKGQAPAEIIKKNIPEMVLLEEMAAFAIGEQFAEIVKENKIETLGRPHITISKIAKGNPLEYNILIATLPELDKKDYKKIAKEVIKEEKDESLDVTDKEIEDTMRTIQKMRIHDALHAHGDNSVHTHDHPELKEENLPALDDSFAQSLGNFKDISELKTKLKENILEEKKLKQKSDKRTRIADALIKETKVELPKILVNAEQEQLFQVAKQNIADAGLKFEDYVKQIGKTEEEMRADFAKDAEKRVTLALVVRDIAKENKLFPETEEINKEVELIMSQYQGADRSRAEAYIEDVLTKEAVMKFLEE